MPYVTKATLANQRVAHNQREIALHLTDFMRRNGMEVDAGSVLAAYLLSKASERPEPMALSYNEVLHLADPDVAKAAEKYLNEKQWEAIKPLTLQYSAEEFAAAAITMELGEYSRSDLMATPSSLAALAMELLNIQPGERVADIGCGCGTFLNIAILDQPDASYFGYEIDRDAYAVSKARAELLSSGVGIHLQDAFLLLQDSPFERFDKIFSNYPFGQRTKTTSYQDDLEKAYPGITRGSSLDWAFNALLCERLKENGKAVGIMTNGGTWNAIDASKRKLFVERGLIECVIALPDKMFSGTSIPTSIIVMSQGNTKVRMIDATELCTQGRRRNEFTQKDLQKVLSALDAGSEYSRIVSLEEIRKNDYALSPSRYLTAEPELGEDAAPFETVIRRITRGASITASQLDEMVTEEETNCRYLNLANIQDGIIDGELPKLDHIDPKDEKYCLKDRDLILSKNGSPYKVAIAEVPEGQKILANGNLYVIELDEDRANPYYIKAFLESERGTAALKSITVGSVIPNIGVDALKKLQIPLPPMEQQQKVALRYQTLQKEIMELKQQLAKAVNQRYHVFNEA